MRMILDIRIPTEKFNAAVRDGTIGSTLQTILEDARPEAVYFTEQDGKRGAIMVVDTNDPAEIPKYAEPWFLKFDAQVRFRIAMSPDDLGRAGLDALGERWG